jgi:hypothetical protein
MKSFQKSLCWVGALVRALTTVVPGSVVSAICLLATVTFSMPVQAVGEACDVALVLVVDSSGSIKADEFERQIDGTAAAFRDKDVISAIRTGQHARIAVSLVFYSDEGTVGVHWHIIHDTISATDFATAVARVARTMRGNTSISAGLTAADHMLSAVPCTPDRMIVDVSGDGVDEACWVDAARDALLRRGAVINALAVGNEDIYCSSPEYRPIKYDDLKEYFDLVVKGGEGSFSVSTPDFDSYVDVIRSKILREIS